MNNLFKTIIGGTALYVAGNYLYNKGRKDCIEDVTSKADIYNKGYEHGKESKKEKTQHNKEEKKS